MICYSQMRGNVCIGCMHRLSTPLPPPRGYERGLALGWPDVDLLYSCHVFISQAKDYFSFILVDVWWFHGFSATLICLYLLGTLSRTGPDAGPIKAFRGKRTVVPMTYLCHSVVQRDHFKEKFGAKLQFHVPAVRTPHHVARGCDK